MANKKPPAKVYRLDQNNSLFELIHSAEILSKMNIHGLESDHERAQRSSRADDAKERRACG